jgi:hypothetical protein
MLRRPNFPFATIILALCIVIPYFLASNGALYLSDQSVFVSSFSIYNLGGWLSHLVTHVGVLHLAGNLLPLLLFGLLLEFVLPSRDVLLLFVSSGLFASGLFSLFNPNAYLVGSSAAVAGVMTAATALRPKKALVLLLLTPLLVSLLLFPLLTGLVFEEQTKLSSEKAALSAQAEVLVQQNRLEEAAEVSESARAVAAEEEAVSHGRERESETPTDFLVHFYGAAFAVFFLVAFKKEELAEGAEEFADLHEKLVSVFNKG